MDYKTLNLDPGENVIMEVRKHWIVFFSYTVGLIVSAFFPFVLFILIKLLLPDAFNIKIPGNVYALLSFFYSLWLLLLWISFFINWTKYYLDVWYVTEKRIIAINQKHIFGREISNLRFDKIQDVTIDVKGFFSTILHFGNIKVQTAGEDNQDFSMRTVRRPQEVRRIIFSQHNVIGDNRPKPV